MAGLEKLPCLRHFIWGAINRQSNQHVKGVRLKACKSIAPGKLAEGERRPGKPPPFPARPCRGRRRAGAPCKFWPGATPSGSLRNWTNWPGAASTFGGLAPGYSMRALRAARAAERSQRPLKYENPSATTGL